MRNHNSGVLSSNPERVTTKTPFVKKAKGGQFIKSNSLEKPRALSLVSAKFEIEYSKQMQDP